jgi:uncharacterized protein (TIGR02246 family)
MQVRSHRRYRVALELASYQKMPTGDGHWWLRQARGRRGGGHPLFSEGSYRWRRSDAQRNPTAEVTMDMGPVNRGSFDDVHDRSALAAVVSGLERAWAAGNGQLWGSYFAEDSDFTVWFGLHLRGRDANAAIHQEVFDSFYEGTKLRLDVRDLRFLRPDVAVVHFDARIVGPGEQLPEQPQFVPVAVMTKEDEVWRIAVFHNTKNTVAEHLGTADVRK